MKFFNLFIFIFSLALFSPLLALADRVGIYGCLHGDKNMASVVAHAMRAQNVTHLIGNGDFGYDLDNILDLVSTASGITRENTYLIPGNWDNLESDYKLVFEKYGNTIVDRYDESGLVEIAGKKIKVAHFPQQPVPRQFLPPDEYLFKFYPNEAHIVSTMAKKEALSPDIYLNVYGHTHIRSDFYDLNSGILTINAGGLTPRKLPSEERSFVILDTETDQVEFYSVEQTPPVLIRKVPVHRPDNDIETQDPYGKTFDLSDFGICQLENPLTH